jgi:menaquinone-9 beta-reductase
MKAKYDVVIAGAGPAGSITAAVLARHGYDVLLIDKQQFPREKICGDALPAQVIDILGYAGMESKVKKAIADGLFNQVSSVRFVSPRGREIVMGLQKSKEGYYPHTTSRLYFDNLIREHAVEAGAQFLQAAAEEPLIESGRVKGLIIKQNGEILSIKAAVTVGADGVNSVIGRRLRGGNRHADKHRALAIRGYCEDFETQSGIIEFFLHRNVLPGYAWIFPIGSNKANIGLGMRLDHYRKFSRSLKKMLQEFLAMPDIKGRLVPGARLTEVASWPLNFGSQKGLQYAFDGAVLVGDAAGYVNPLSGGGIHSSLVSGLLAAEAIQKALDAKDTSRTRLTSYEVLCRERLLNGQRRSYYIQKALFRFPCLVDLSVKHAGGTGPLKHLLAGKF